MDFVEDSSKYRRLFAARLFAKLETAKTIEELREAAQIALEILIDEVREMPPDVRRAYILRVLKGYEGVTHSDHAEAMMEAFWREAALRYGVPGGEDPREFMRHRYPQFYD